MNNERNNSKETQEKFPEMEVKINDRIRMMIRVDGVMDPQGFLEMVNSVKAFVRTQAPAGQMPGERQTSEKKMEKMREVAVLVKQGMKVREIAEKVGKSEATIHHWKMQMKDTGMI